MKMQRNTRQRAYILKEVSQRSDHPTARDVYMAVRKKLPNISLTTVYRNLTNLADEGLILRINVPSSPERFDKTVTTHLHTLCDECRAFADVSQQDQLFELIKKTVLASNNFHASGMDLIIRGKCSECEKKETAVI
jgi:Fur family peroxide stress response transcriptional regulator